MNNLIQLKNVTKNYISSKKIEVLKNINYIVALIFIFYQTSIYSKSTSLEKFDSNIF